MSTDTTQPTSSVESMSLKTQDGNSVVVKAIRVAMDKAAEDERSPSRKIPIDAFKGDYADQIIEPPFDPFVLATMPEQSTILGPCIDAMSINIEGLGHRIVPRDNLHREKDEIASEVQNEITKVSNFFDNAVLEGTFKQARKKWRGDLETGGNAYIEVQPSLMRPEEPAGLKHIPAWTMRLAHADPEPTRYEIPRAVRVSKDKWEIKMFPNRKYFRRFVQRKDYYGKKVWFKEWGDPRVISYKTGEVLADSWKDASEAQRKEAANPIIHLKLYCPRSPYGLPRTIGNLFTFYGNREAEKINYTTLKCNNIPALMMMVTNARLTNGSIKRIREFVEERIQSDNNYSTILIVESEPVSEGMRDPGTMKMQLEPLKETQHTDQMFTEYMDRGDNKIRQSFRLPPIFLGSTVEYNRATAEASKSLAEEQVFKPERDDIDDVFNTTLVPALGAANVLFKSNTASTTDDYALTQLLAVAERSGGLSPHISRIVVEEVLGRDLPEVDESINPHLPFTLTMLREQMTMETNAEGEVTKVWSDSDVLQQLKTLKGMMSGAEGISDDAKKSIDTLISVMEMGGYSEEIKMGMLPCTQKTKSDEPVEKTIVQEGDQWCVYSEDGDTNFGCYDTKDEAVERLGQIEGFSKRYKLGHILKSEVNEQRIIGGAVLVPGQVDLQGDTYDDIATTAAAHYWMENINIDEEHGIKLMHQGETILDAARAIESYVLKEDTTFEVEVPAVIDGHPSKELTTITYPKGTWMLYARVINDELWDAVKAGDYLGWSIGGVALVQQLKQYVKSLLLNAETK